MIWRREWLAAAACARLPTAKRIQQLNGLMADALCLCCNVVGVLYFGVMGV